MTSITMPGAAAVKRRQLGLILFGFLSWGLALWLCLTLWPQMAARPAAVDRLLYALQLLALPAVLATLHLMSCFRVFDPAAADPLAGAESRRWKINQRALQNTVEQSWIFVPLLLALSVRLDPADLHILPIATGLWIIGRLAFWIGYRIDPQWRGPGFEWTLSSSLLLLGWFIATLF